MFIWIIRLLIYVTVLYIRAFQSIGQHTLVLDVAHLNGEFKGTMLLAVAMDRNSQILHVAYEIAKGEYTKSWSWFL